ncbi:MAG: NusA-like transcription termination signal-binding factor [Candidatus Aenigmarchaeota archaeon]|nr:NusA-like transcription termination signal-binding factor [Candidatus Aenigmarchaeota archaeon]
MKVILDEQTIQSISFFQKLTGASIIDSVTDEDTLYFVVDKGQYGMAVGRSGEKIRKAEALFKKRIRIFEYADTVEDFLKNAIPEAKKIASKDEAIEITISNHDRPKVIGRSGGKIKILNNLIERLYSKKNIRILTPMRL